MFTIRKPHMDAFTQAAREGYEDRMIEQLQLRFPEQCGAMPDAALTKLIWEGTARAGGHGITAEKDVAVFLRYQMSLGRDFDTNKKTAWAGEVLKDERFTAEQKLARIREIALSRKAELKK